MTESTEPSDIEENGPESNLFRHESGKKWNNPLIDKQKKEMSKQLIHLAKQHKESIKSNNEFIFL